MNQPLRDAWERLEPTPIGDQVAADLARKPLPVQASSDGMPAWLIVALVAALAVLMCVVAS